MKDIKTDCGKRKCFHCSEFKSTIKSENPDQHSIGFCRKYHLKVIDTLCGCKEKDGKTIFYNFNEYK